MRRRRAALAGLGLAAGLAAGAWAEEPETAAAAPKGEFLVAARPIGWKLGYHGRRDKVSLAEFVPEAQDGEDWRDQIAVRVFAGLGRVPPAAFLERVKDHVRDTCDRAWFGPTEDRRIDGYGVAVLSASCGRNRISGLGEFAIYKVIQGRENLYMVQRTWRIPPGDEPMPLAEDTLAAGVAYLAGVHVCDTRDPGRPCPPGVGEAAPAVAP